MTYALIVVIRHTLERLLTMLTPVSQGTQDTDGDGQLTLEEMMAAKMKASGMAAEASGHEERVKLGAGAPEATKPKQGFIGLEISQDHPHRVAKVAD